MAEAGSGQVAPPLASGPVTRSRPSRQHLTPRLAPSSSRPAARAAPRAAGRRRRRRPAPPAVPSTNHVDPLPARWAGAAGGVLEGLLPPDEPGLHHHAAASRSLEVDSARRASSRPPPVRPRPGRRRAVSTPKGGSTRRNERASKGSGTTLLADARHQGPPTGQAEGDVGPEPGRHARVGAPRPPQDGGGIGRPAAQAGPGRDPLHQPDRRRPADGVQRPGHQVVRGRPDVEVAPPPRRPPGHSGTTSSRATAGPVVDDQRCRPGRG